MSYTVYKHTSPSGKVYIGITCQKPRARWKNGYGYKEQNKFYNAICKYGWDNFKHEILYKNLTIEEAEQKEIELITLYDSKNNGYNATDGGRGTSGVVLNEEISCERSKIATNIYPKIKDALLKGINDYWSNIENRNKRSENQKGEKASWYGKHFSDEARKKLSESKKGKPALNRKKVMCLNDNKEFSSMHEVAEYYGCSVSMVSMICSGKKKNFKGLIFKEVS